MPPLNYERVYQLKRDFPQLTIIINGGIDDGRRSRCASAPHRRRDARAHGLPRAVSPGRARTSPVRHAAAVARIGDRTHASVHRGASRRRRQAAAHQPAHAGPVPGPARRARLAAAPSARTRIGRTPASPWSSRRCAACRSRLRAAGCLTLSRRWRKFGAGMAPAGSNAAARQAGFPLLRSSKSSSGPRCLDVKIVLSLPPTILGLYRIRSLGE